ncbi:hypothetical protein PMI12_00726 [Variovorax sp. CF313]|nr:hypothetical protein PMI12_00726 [Variovorax sp. CF313]
MAASSDILDVRENGVVGTVTGNGDYVGTANGATGDSILDAGVSKSSSKQVRVRSVEIVISAKPKFQRFG